MQLESWELKELIEQYGECEWLDYKQAWYAKEKKADLVHDILSMSNADVDGDRFIVIGVSDEGNIVGLHRALPENEFRSDIREVVSNRVLPVEYYECSIEGKIVGVVHIFASAHAPIFLQKDFSRAGKTVRAGVVYTRNGSNNTPIDRTAHDAEVERLWRRRLGLDLTPKDRVLKLLREPDKWISSNNPDSDNIFHYHHDNPEFTLTKRLGERENFWEPWVERIPDEFQKSQAQNTSVWEYFVRFHSTTLFSGILMHVRHTIMPFPVVESAAECKKSARDMRYVLRDDTTDYFVAAISVRDRWEYDPEISDSLELLDKRVMEDIFVMFGSDVFYVQKRRYDDDLLHEPV